AHKGTVLDAEFSPDGTRIVTASEDNTARVWDAATGEALTPPLRHPRAVLRADFSPDGNQALTICGDQKKRTWDLTPDDRPVETLLYLSHVLAGGRIDSDYGLLPLSSAALRSDWDAIRPAR